MPTSVTPVSTSRPPHLCLLNKTPSHLLVPAAAQQQLFSAMLHGPPLIHCFGVVGQRPPRAPIEHSRWGHHLQDLRAEVSRISFRKQHQVRPNSELEARIRPESSEHQCVSHRDKRLGEIQRGSRRYPFPQTTPSLRNSIMIYLSFGHPWGSSLYHPSLILPSRRAARPAASAGQ